MSNSLSKHKLTLYYVGLPVAVVAIISLVIMMAWPVKRQVVNQVTSACPETTLTDQVAAADVIATGTVFMVVPEAGHALVIIDPLRVYRGQIIGADIRILAADVANLESSPDSNQLNFASGQSPYLLFLKASPNGQYTNSHCFGSRLLGQGLTTAEQQLLGEGTPFVPVAK